VTKNTLYIFAGRASNALFFFLLALVVSRQLGPDFFGVFSFLTTVVISANCFSNLGLDIWMVREVTKAPSKGKWYLSSILGLKMVTSLVTIILVFLVFRVTDLPQTTLKLLGILSASIFLNTVSQTLWHYGNCFKQFIYHSVLWATSNIIKAVLGIALVFLFHDLKILIVGIVVAEAISMILSFYIIRRKFGSFVPVFQFTVWKDFLARSAPIGMGMIFGVLYFRLDIVMLQLMTEEKVVGFYNAAYKLFEVSVVLSHSFMVVLFPTLVEEHHYDQVLFKKRFKRVIAIFSLIGGSIALVLWSFSHEIIKMIYGDKFFPSAQILDVLAVSTLLFFISFLLSHILISSGRERVNTWNLIGVFVLNITLNLAWIPQYGAIGAAWATLFCEIVLVAMLSFQTQKSFE
jgi:O-antigen/teichoic acid export membrane protein